MWSFNTPFRNILEHISIIFDIVKECLPLPLNFPRYPCSSNVIVLLNPFLAQYFFQRTFIFYYYYFYAQIVRVPSKCDRPNYLSYYYKLFVDHRGRETKAFSC